MNTADVRAVLDAHDAGDAELEAKLAKVTQEATDLSSALTRTAAERDDAVKAYANHMATAHPVEPTGPGIVSVAKLAGADLSAKLLTAQGQANKVSFGPTVYEAVDFDASKDHRYGIFAYQTKGLLGSGPKTVLSVKPMSSTKGAQVPADAGTTERTNQFYLARVDGATKAGAPPTEVANLTFLGTPQGHMYNGLMLYYGVALVHDVLVKGIPGDAAANPGETFPINAFHQVGSVLRNVVVDGTDATGKRVTASGVGINSSQGLLVDGGGVSNTGYGAGYASYLSSDLTFQDGFSTDTAYYGMNFENCSGVQRITRWTFLRNAQTKTGSEKAVHLAVATNQGSAQYIITDPIFDGPKFRVRSTGYKGKPKTQRDADIRLYIDGVERPDLLTIVTS
jgi:hypothetical protein